MTFTQSHALGTMARTLSSVLVFSSVFGVGARWAGSTTVQAQAGRRVEKDTASYTTKRVYKVGETDRYTVTAKISVTPTIGESVDMVWNLLFIEKTRAVKAEGSSTVTSEFETASLEINGMDSDLIDKMPKLTTTHDKDGNADVKMDGGDDEVTEMMDGWGEQLTATDMDDLLPPEPVKVGDSWEMDPDSFDKEAGKVTGKSTLVSVETVQGMKVAKIKQVMDILSPRNSKRHTETTVLVEIATGKPVSLTTKITASSDDDTVSFETTLKRLLPEKKANPTTPAKSGVKKP